MIRRLLLDTLARFGYAIYRTEPLARVTRRPAIPDPPPVDPIWPLPCQSAEWAAADIRRAFSKFALWHYAYQFEGGIAFAARHNDPDTLSNCPERPLQRFRHVMPDLLAANNDSLKGKRVLDIACNSGFWAIECALLGANVVGFDARPELVEQANLIKSITGVGNVDFRVLDFWEMSPESLGGTFDIVLNLGILYHLPQPLEVLRRTIAMATHHVLLDTATYPVNAAAIGLKWEEPVDVRRASRAGLVAAPSKMGIDMILRHIGVRDWFEIPIRTTDVPRDYLQQKRASWLIRVG